MKILFIVDRLGFLDHLTIPVVSAAIKKNGHSVRLSTYSNNKKRCIQDLLEYKPDIVAYSIRSEEAKQYLHINKTLKSHANFFSVFGGPHPTFFQDIINNNEVDAICRGEGDIVFPLFVNTFKTPRMYDVNNFSFKLQNKTVRHNLLINLIGNLDSLPLPDRELIFEKSSLLAANPIKTFMASRGCPYKCTYCFNHEYNTLYKDKGDIVRSKSVPYLINEIKSVAATYPMTFIKFHDDVFGIKNSWLEEFSIEYPIKINLPFLCYSRPEMITDRYCSLLRKAGCYSVCMAVECGNECLRSNVLNRKFSNKKIINAGSLLKKYGLHVYTLNMVGLPQETEENMFETIKINQIIAPDYADASVFQPYPGTRITEFCKKINILDRDIYEFKSQYSTSVLSISKIQKNKVEVVQKLFPIIIDHKWIIKIYPLLVKTKTFNPLLRILCRFYYGYFLHKRIYKNKIPFTIRLKGLLSILFSKDRT